MDSVKQLQQEKSEYLSQFARSSSVSLLSGSEILGIVQQHVRHIERCMRAVLESYQRAFADANQTPTEDDFTKILEEAQSAREQQVKNSTHAVGNFIASRGGSNLPPGVRESALDQIRTSSGQGHDRVLREWKIWRDKARLLRSTRKPQPVFTNPPSSVKAETARSAFISYSWDDEPHCDWVRRLAERLRADGVAVSIDRWETVPGDQLPAFMERAIRENGFVVIICTPRYKQRSNTRQGGVGYEGDIMTAEISSTQNQRKFIPIWRSGSWQEAAPSWLAGKYYINLTGEPYSERDYEDLVRTLLGIREIPPPIGKPMSTIVPPAGQVGTPFQADASSSSEDIKITRVIVEEVTEPKNDGTSGSALYTVPFALSKTPPSTWAELFIKNWNHPPRFTTMHRPGIAKISGATVVLAGTTIEEVERYHRDTLQLAINETNSQYKEHERLREQSEAQKQFQSDRHRKLVEDTSKRIKFD